MKILILDDDDAILELCNKFLDDMTNNIYKTLNQEAAFNYLRLDKADLFIIDHNLEEGTGLDFIEDLRSKGIETRCILCSSSFTDKIKNIALLFDNVDLLEKPFNKEELLKLITPAPLT